MKVSLEIDKLFAAAREVFPNAYSPYSSFPVAAAVRCRDGRIFAGVNIENISYGLTICAERAAVAAAVTAGCTYIDAVLILTKTGHTTPCGACRQVLSEFNPEMKVYLSDIFGNIEEHSLLELLPYSFGKNGLRGE